MLFICTVLRNSVMQSSLVDAGASGDKHYSHRRLTTADLCCCSSQSHADLPPDG